MAPGSHGIKAKPLPISLQGPGTQVPGCQFFSLPLNRSLSLLNQVSQLLQDLFVPPWPLPTLFSTQNSPVFSQYYGNPNSTSPNPHHTRLCPISCLGLGFMRGIELSPTQSQDQILL